MFNFYKEKETVNLVKLDLDKFTTMEQCKSLIIVLALAVARTKYYDNTININHDLLNDLPALKDLVVE